MNYQTLNSDEKTRLVSIILDSIDESMGFCRKVCQFK